MRIKILTLTLCLVSYMPANAVFGDGDGEIKPQRPPTNVTFSVSSDNLPTCLSDEEFSYGLFRMRIVAGKAMDREWLLSGPTGSQQVHQVKSVFLVSTSITQSIAPTFHGYVKRKSS